MTVGTIFSRGGVKITNSHILGRLSLVGATTTHSAVCNTDVAGTTLVLDNSDSVLFSTIVCDSGDRLHTVKVIGNAADVVIDSTSITGNLVCLANQPYEPIVTNVTVTGKRSGQCAA